MARRVTHERTDPLERIGTARTLVAGVVAVTAVAFVLGSRRSDPDPLPGIALDSPFLLDLGRALIVGALFAAVAISVVRGWSGYFPLKLSTTGAEYAQREEGLAAELKQLMERQAITTTALRSLLAERGDRIGGGGGETASFDPVAGRDDTLWP